MTLEEAIKHAEEVEELHENRCKFYTEHDMPECEPPSRKCAKEHRQLAEWLRELKTYKESDWILCSERMPEEYEWLGTRKFGTTKSDEVFVTFENPKGERFCQHLSFQNGKLNRYDQSFIDTWYKGSKPIAWKHFPDPYGGEQNDTD